MVSLWVPQAFVVSFKLETDENILIAKARDSLNKYKHKLVVGNMLQTRRQKVVFVTPESSYEVLLSREQMINGMEIEDLIVSNVVISHSNFLASFKY